MQTQLWSFVTGNKSEYEQFESAAIQKGFWWVDRRIEDFFCYPLQKYKITVSPKDFSMDWSKSDFAGCFWKESENPVFTELTAALAQLDKIVSDKDEDEDENYDGVWCFRALNDKMSREFQEMAFKHGYKWKSDCKNVCFLSEGEHLFYIYPTDKFLRWNPNSESKNPMEKTLKGAKDRFEAQAASKKDFQDFWISSSDGENSEAIQRVAFSFGYRWIDSQDQSIRKTGGCCLVFSPNNKTIMESRAEGFIINGECFLDGHETGVEAWIKMFKNPPRERFSFNDGVKILSNGGVVFSKDTSLNSKEFENLIEAWKKIKS